MPVSEEESSEGKKKEGRERQRERKENREKESEDEKEQGCARKGAEENPVVIIIKTILHFLSLSLSLSPFSRAVDLQFGIEQGVDLIFASFIRKRQDLLDIRKVK